MLRISSRSVRTLGGKLLTAGSRRQWQAAVTRPAPLLVGQRCYGDKKPLTEQARPAALPSSETLTSPSTPPPANETVAGSGIAPESAPLTPHPPPRFTAELTAGPEIRLDESSPALPPPSRKKKGFLKRLRNYVLTLSLLAGLAFGGGVWYSRMDDKFHDFFIEYMPYGERVVLFLEEMDFRKRFPNASTRVMGRRKDDSDRVRIPAQSGVSWRVADTGEATSRQSSAMPKANAGMDERVNMAEAATVKEAGAESSQLPTVEAKASSRSVSSPSTASTPASKTGTMLDMAAGKSKDGVASTATKDFKAPDVEKAPPASAIDPLAVKDASEPIVQDLFRILNDIITVINHDQANDKYGASIRKAKNEINRVGQKIRDMKDAIEKQAARELGARASEFDKAAGDLVTHIESIMLQQEARFRKEFEEEVRRIEKSYDGKIKLITEREEKLEEERMQNRLLEQAVEMQRHFAEDIKRRVEEERGGRLGQLEQLSLAVADLERLTTGWNEVVDTSTRRQQLHVAVDAVRASLEDSASRRPFIKELVALKEIASEDAVVGAAIASINPSAYQRGIPSPAELVDRFRRVATEVRKASLLPEEAGVLSHASSWALSHVLFKRQGLAAGDDVESILTRTQTYLEEGDLDKAAREMNGLSGWAKTLSRDWLAEVRKVLEVKQALDVIQTEARLQSLMAE